jgi:flagellar FliJ protein
MAFRFRLETVLRVRRRREEAAALELAAAQRAQRGQEEMLAGLEDGRRRERQALERLARKGLLARDLLLHQDYEWALAWRLERERRHLGELAAACEEKREALLARSREKKVLENLKERQHKLWRQEEARREQKLLDELGGRLPLARARQERGT